jgi:hypothetical protein
MQVTNPIDSSIYSQYSHLKTPVRVGSLVYAKGKDGPIACEIIRLGADHLYVQFPGARLSSLLYPCHVWNTPDEVA